MVLDLIFGLFSYFIVISLTKNVLLMNVDRHALSLQFCISKYGIIISYFEYFEPAALIIFKNVYSL